MGGRVATTSLVSCLGDEVLSGDLALDFGSVNTRVANARGKLIYDEPTLVAMNLDSGKPVHFGRHAMGNGAQSAGRLRVVRPVAAGQLKDLAAAEVLLKHVIDNIGRARFQRRRVLVTTPLGTTPVQLRAMAKALGHAGVHSVRFLEQPLASAIGAKVAIEAPVGVMAIDVGGEITNLAAIALGGVIVGTTVPCGGETLDRAIALDLLDRTGLVIDRAVANQVRTECGSIGLSDRDVAIDVVGRDRANGIARTVRTQSQHVSEVLRHEFAPVCEAASRLITDSPPDIANDLMTSGIVLSGGGSRLVGVGELLAKSTGIPVHVYENPERLGVLGAAKCLGSYRDLEDAFISAPPH